MYIWSSLLGTLPRENSSSLYMRQLFIHNLLYIINLWCLPALQNTRSNSGQVYNTVKRDSYDCESTTENA